MNGTTPSQIKEKVKQLRALAGEADDGEDAANAGGDGADGSEPGLEQSEVQYAGEELVTTVVTTTEVTPLSFDTRAPTFEKVWCLLATAVAALDFSSLCLL